MLYLIGGVLFFISLKLNETLLQQKAPTYYLALTPICALSFGSIKLQEGFLFLFLLTLLLWQITLMDLMSLSIYSIYLYLYGFLCLYSWFILELSFTSRLLAFGIYTLSLSLYHYFRKEALGEGDILFIALSSLALGVYGTSILLLIATLTAFLGLLLRKIFFKVSLTSPLAFFPFLCLGSYLVYLAFFNQWLTLI